MHDNLLMEYTDVYADVVKMILNRDVGLAEIASPLRTFHQQEPLEVRNQIFETQRIIHVDKMKIQINLIGVGQYADRDWEMPVKIYCQNQEFYEQQLRRGEMILCPIESMVLYFGLTKWSGPLALSEILDMPEGICSHFTDFRVKLLDVGALTPNQVDQFDSDFYIVADYLSQMRQQGVYVPREREIDHPEALVEFMATIIRKPFLQLSDLITVSSP